MAPKTLPNNGADWSALTRLRTAVITTLLLLGTIRTIGAQSTEAPNDVAVRIGPLALAPVVSLYDAGRDDNVYNRSVGFNPQGDLTATTRLTVDEWLRMSRARMYRAHPARLSLFQGARRSSCARHRGDRARRFPVEPTDALRRRGVHGREFPAEPGNRRDRPPAGYGARHRCRDAVEREISCRRLPETPRPGVQTMIRFSSEVTSARSSTTPRPAKGSR